MEYCCMEKMIEIYRENDIEGRRCFKCGNQFWYNKDGTKEWKIKIMDETNQFQEDEREEEIYLEYEKLCDLPKVEKIR